MLFSTSVSSCAETFTQNAPILSKVYFPRLVMPLSSLLSAYIHFFLQMLPALGFYFYYIAVAKISVFPQYLLLLPLSLLQIGLLGYGVGIIVAALTDPDQVWFISMDVCYTSCVSAVRIRHRRFLLDIPESCDIPD